MCQLKQFPSCKLEVRPRDDFPDHCVAVVTVIYVQGYIKQRRVGNGQSECFFSPPPDLTREVSDVLFSLICHRLQS